ncbi:hypothetical protein GS504_03185 [Rhodococcus hoagii]|nr:hypothetical protein [Prescottella equi]
MTAVATITALIVDADGRLEVAALPVDDFWTSRRVSPGRAAALDAIGTMHGRYFAVGGSRPGVACMAVDGTIQHDERQPVNETATRVLERYGMPADTTRTVRGRAVILAGFDFDPQPIPAGAAHELAILICRPAATPPPEPVAV